MFILVHCCTRKAKAQTLKVDDIDNDIAKNTSESTSEVKERQTFEEDIPPIADKNVEDVQHFNEPSMDTDLEELMDGICPEDMSFNISSMTTPQKEYPPQPLHKSTPNVNADDKTIATSSPVTEGKEATATPGSKISKSVVEKVNKVLGPDFQGFKLSSEVKNTSLKQCNQLTVYPKGTFYGLPEDIFTCLEEFKGIKKLYGQDE